MMRCDKLTIIFAVAVLTGCATISEQGTLAELRSVKIELKDEKIDGGLEKAMASYQRFLEKTPETAMTPEAIRRLADLKVERGNAILDQSAGRNATATGASAPNAAPPPRPAPTGKLETNPGANVIASVTAESDADFEKRATAARDIPASKQAAVPLPDGSSPDLNNVDAKEAIALYKQLMEKFPLYERNDQVLYQMSRAYEEQGEVEEAMKVMNRIVKEYPDSRYTDEVQFRRAEYFFTRKKFLDAEDAYKQIVRIGQTSSYYDLALYKLGWTFYKQELYEDSLQYFMSLLDHKVATGYDFEQTEDRIEKKRIDDTYRVISLSFSNLDGASSIIKYFDRVGRKPYEVGIYSNLAEHYFVKRRYGDAAKTYNAFVERNTFHKASPHFHMRMVEIYQVGRFPRLVVEAKRSFASAYGLRSEYWRHFDIKSYPEVMGHLQTNIRDLAVHYHALYRNPDFRSKQKELYTEAGHWYREYIASFPQDETTPKLHYQLAELLLQGKEYARSATEYERVAYHYPAHEQSSAAGYAAVYAFREHLKRAQMAEIPVARQEVIRASLKFADAFPKHEKAVLVLAAAADDLFEVKAYNLAISTAKKLIDNHPDAEAKLRRGAWLVVSHSSYETAQYKEAEQGYINVLALTGDTDKDRTGLVNNLAASIYKQGEVASKQQDYKTAANHFLRIASVAPNSEVRKTAEFDGASMLIKLNDWDRAASVLVAFRKTFRDPEMAHEATKKLAIVYQEAERYPEAAVEFERIARESRDDEVRREALILAAQMYEKVEKHKLALAVYQRYVDLFPKPLEFALETRYKMARLYKSWGQETQYRNELRRIISVDAGAGAERTDRTRYLAANSALSLVEIQYQAFAAIELKQPLKRNLKKKNKVMKSVVADLNDLVRYKVGEVTAGATYYLAETYYNFSRSLATSERPKKLNQIEKEEYETALEEQIFPFEEKAIAMHRKNLELIAIGVVSTYIDRSLERLAGLMPARYAKFEQSTGFISTMGSYQYEFIASTVENVPPEVSSSGPMQSSGLSTDTIVPPLGQNTASETKPQTRRVVTAITAGAER